MREGRVGAQRRADELRARGAEGVAADVEGLQGRRERPAVRGEGVRRAAQIRAEIAGPAALAEAVALRVRALREGRGGEGVA